jgi:hypothetical protein
MNIGDKFGVQFMNVSLLPHIRSHLNYSFRGSRVQDSTRRVSYISREQWEGARLRQSMCGFSLTDLLGDEQ